ncbi:MAG TPA: hypothetical protein VJM74_02900, partial [Nitrososphaeraceae archaeon]|nr:hypothetical protein [Nitrososphaeraceae archaeon]
LKVQCSIPGGPNRGYNTGPPVLNFVLVLKNFYNILTKKINCDVNAVLIAGGSNGHPSSEGPPVFNFFII